MSGIISTSGAPIVTLKRAGGITPSRPKCGSGVCAAHSPNDAHGTDALAGAEEHEAARQQVHSESANPGAEGGTTFPCSRGGRLLAQWRVIADTTARRSDE
jgi:hypothetical protein